MDRPAHDRTTATRVLAGALCALVCLIPVSEARAGISPEFDAILGNTNGDFKVNGPQLKDCDGSTLEIARQAMQRRRIGNIMAGPVVVSAFENACKPVLDAFGLGIVGTSYSVAKCAFEYLDGTTDTKGFGACLIAEGVSYAVGKAFEKVDIDSATAAGLNVPAGKGLDVLKGMVNDWHHSASQTEFDTVTYGADQGFPCQVELSVQWNKPSNPAREQGSVVIAVSISGCDCSRSGTSYSRKIASGVVFYRVPVRFWNRGGKPAWFVDNARATLEVRSQCCGQSSRTIRVYSNAGTLLRSAIEGQEPPASAVTPGPRPGPGPVQPPPKPTPPPPPPPKPKPPPPPPPKPQWPVDPGEQLKACPECASIARDIELTRAGIGDVDKRIADLQRALAQNQASQVPLTRRIAALQAELDRQAGTGGSSYDPSTGIRITAITKSDGSVEVTTRDADGNVIEQHTRPRRDLGKVKDEMAQVQRQLDEVRKAEATLKAQIAQARTRREGLVADLRRLEQELAACLARCRERFAGGPAITVETVTPVAGNNPFDPVNPLGTGTTPTPTGGGGQCRDPQPPSTRTLPCPAGQSGSIVQNVSYACSGGRWIETGATTVSNTCSSTPATCTTPQPQPDTRTLPCPAGQSGTITQQRTYSCVGTSWVPGDFVTTANNCVAPPSGCAAAFSTGAFSCSGSCGIGTTSLSVPPSGNTMTANNFGANPSAAFNCLGTGAASASNNLTILGQPGHTCSLNGQGANAFAVACRNNSGGSCTSSCSR